MRSTITEMKNLLGGFKSIFERAGEKNQEYIFVRWICPMNWNTESREWKEKKKMKTSKQRGSVGNQ